VSQGLRKTPSPGRRSALIDERGRASLRDLASLREEDQRIWAKGRAEARSRLNQAVMRGFWSTAGAEESAASPRIFNAEHINYPQSRFDVRNLWLAVVFTFRKNLGRSQCGAENSSFICIF